VTRLPPEILLAIFQHLETADRKSAAMVCTSWWPCAKDIRWRQPTTKMLDGLKPEDGHSFAAKVKSLFLNIPQ
jgi:hypothetical protein